MQADAQLSWIASAIDALEDIRASEVKAVSAEVRRSVTRPAQIVPEIARLVAERRQRGSQVVPPLRKGATNAEICERRNALLLASLAVTKDPQPLRLHWYVDGQNQIQHESVDDWRKREIDR